MAMTMSEKTADRLERAWIMYVGNEDWEYRLANDLGVRQPVLMSWLSRETQAPEEIDAKLDALVRKKIEKLRENADRFERMLLE